MEHREADRLVRNERKARLGCRPFSEQLLTKRRFRGRHAVGEPFEFREAPDHSQDRAGIVGCGRNDSKGSIGDHGGHRSRYTRRDSNRRIASMMPTVREVAPGRLEIREGGGCLPTNSANTLL